MQLLIFNLAMDIDDPILGFTSGWISRLAQNVDRIFVITMRAGKVKVPDNVEVYSVGKEKGYSEARRAMEFYRHLAYIFSKTSVDACFSHMMPLFTVMAASLLRLKRVPIITWYAHPSLTTTLKLAHHLSDHMVSSLPTAYPYKSDKLIVIGQGIDTDLFSPGDNQPEQPPLILCAGRLSLVKDHPTLLEAVSLLQTMRPEPFRVAIVGSPLGVAGEAYTRSLTKKVHELGIQDIVHFEPGLPSSELVQWYRRSTVHVNLTPRGFGDKVAWEAMSCGRPCVVANDGFVETLGQFRNRLLFQYRQAQDLAEKLYWLLTLGENERLEMGAYLRQRTVQEHSLEQLVRKLVLILESSAKY